MYSGIKKIEEVIEYIEENITSEIDCELLARKMSLSVYEFRRIFSFLLGCPLSEYIRKRRLTLAGCEIMASENPDFTSLSEKYCYGSPSAFTKAFREFHGFSPSDIRSKKGTVSLFTVPKIEISVSERSMVPFKIIEEDSFTVSGYSGISEITDTCCCENIWNAFYDTETDKKLSNDKLYAVYENSPGEVLCTIGAKNVSTESVLDSVSVNGAKWACFTLDTVDDDAVNEFYSKISSQYLPSANLCRNPQLPTIEVFPFDMTECGFEWEIRIPVEIKNK